MGVLIGCALRPKMRPGADSDYRTLLGRYRSDVKFRNAVDSVLDGLDTQVLSASDLGLVLGVRRGRNDQPVSAGPDQTEPDES